MSRQLRGEVVKIFSVDCETDGLYGDIWSVGAAVIDPETQTMQLWYGLIDTACVQDQWVRENIVSLVDFPPNFETREDMLNGFWAFWMQYREDSICVADFGTPVEAGLFRACVALDPDNRTWEGPYPMHELGTALLLNAIDVDVNRREMAGRDDLVQHHPVHDAIAAALCWLKIVKL